MMKPFGMPDSDRGGYSSISLLDSLLSQTPNLVPYRVRTGPVRFNDELRQYRQFTASA